MAKKKNYYYVLVFTLGGPAYVTSTGAHKTAYWNKDEKPMSMGKDEAYWMAMGLNLNGSSAVMVVMPYELDYQPYNYQHYEFKLEAKEAENEENE